MCSWVPKHSLHMTLSWLRWSNRWPSVGPAVPMVALQASAKFDVLEESRADERIPMPQAALDTSTR